MPHLVHQYSPPQSYLARHAGLIMIFVHGPRMLGNEIAVIRLGINLPFCPKKLINALYTFLTFHKPDLCPQTPALACKPAVRVRRHI